MPPSLVEAEKRDSRTATWAAEGNGVARSRTPHPYHRRSESLKYANDASTSPDGGTTINTPAELSDSSDRGTEADDEKGPILKSLPAPPLRARKGLRGHHSPIDVTPGITPLPTPPAASEQRRFFQNGASRSAKDEKAPAIVVRTQQDRYEKYRRRRRAEVVRRATETLLLLFMGLTVAANPYRSGLLNPWISELAAFVTSVLVLYIAYPFRLSWSSYQAGSDAATALRRGFHLPSRFDPGQLLYPVFLPLFLAFALCKSTSVIVPVNIVLGLSALPPKTISSMTTSAVCEVQWLITLLPVGLNFARILSLDDRRPTNLKFPADGRVTVENVTLLFPLHQSLLRLIAWLTATSLDPSEAQLLSTGLINLLLFASSPQAEILKSLMWLGGTLTFVSCRHALIFEVTLARIPSWRLVRNRSSKVGLKGAFNRLLLSIFSERRLSPFPPAPPGSDSDLSESSRGTVSRPNPAARVRSDFQMPPIDKVLDARPADEAEDANGLVRSATFSAFGRTVTTTAKRLRKNRKTVLPRFWTLTYPQAQALKWLLAAYVYCAVLLVIALPVRVYVARRALLGSEPVGWALGYLLGNLASVRFFVVSNSLEHWVQLPPRIEAPAALSQWPGLDWYRQFWLGSANTRLTICAYYMLVLTVGISAVLRLGSVVEVDTRRKVFHGVMVAMLLPTIYVDPCFVALALVLILAIFLLLDLFRASQLPPVSRPLTNFLAPYVDGRDHRGPVVVSHIFLLIGCAIPLWLSLSGSPRIGPGPWDGWDTAVRDLGMVSGVVCVGMGDAAASIVGRRYGKTKWYWGGGKSLEGSAAFALAVTAGLSAAWIWSWIGRWEQRTLDQLPLAVVKCLVVGMGASLLESTLTAANDNVVVPVGLWLLVRGLKI